MSKKGSEFTLKDYRAAIRQDWLPIVGRQRLSSAEYEMIQKWFAALIPLNLVLKAIQQVAERAKRSGITIYSLGVIGADLEQLRRAKAAAFVGDHSGRGADHWRERWAEDLDILTEGATSPEEAAMYRELLGDLPRITLDQAKARWKEIQRLH